MNRTMTDLRGYTVHEPEGASPRSKLLAAAAVILGVAAIGAYAYTSHSLLPSAPAPQKIVAEQPVPLTPPAQPATTQPQTPAPQIAPQVQAPAPEINAPAPQAVPKTRSSRHVTHAKPRIPETQKPVSRPAVTPPDTTQVPATPSQTVTPNTSAPGMETTTPYIAAPATPQNATPQSTVPDSTTTQQPQATPDQSARQTQSPQ